MTKDEAMKLALEALEYHQAQTRPIQRTIDAITALRTAIEEAEQQEPVTLDDIEQYRLQMAGISTAAIGYWKEGDSFVTSEEGIKYFARAIEAKLKEKNHENHT